MQDDGSKPDCAHQTQPRGQERRTLMLEACAWRCICSMASTLKKLALQAGVRIQGTVHISKSTW